MTVEYLYYDYLVYCECGEVAKFYIEEGFCICGVCRDGWPEGEFMIDIRYQGLAILKLKKLENNA